MTTAETTAAEAAEARLVRVRERLAVTMDSIADAVVILERAEGERAAYLQRAANGEDGDDGEADRIATKDRLDMARTRLEDLQAQAAILREQVPIAERDHRTAVQELEHSEGTALLQHARSQAARCAELTEELSLELSALWAITDQAKRLLPQDPRPMWEQDYYFALRSEAVFHVPTLTVHLPAPTIR